MGLEEKIENLPDKSGVYIFKDEKGRVLYVGKARSLRKRVRSYLKTPIPYPRIRKMINLAKDLEYVVTDNEIEALILECNLIKQYKPRYNVRLKDDKKYPFIKITVNEPFPKIFITRVYKEDGGRYFGPYADVGAARRTLKLLRRLFPIRSCNRTIQENLAALRHSGGVRTPSIFIGRQVLRPCLNYDIGLCSGPCAGLIDRDAYRKLVEGACLFLEGKIDELEKNLLRQMQEAAENLRFEEAAVLRDRLEDVRKTAAGQRMAVLGGGDEDYIAVAKSGKVACVNLFFVRDGKGLGQEQFYFDKVEDVDEGGLLETFIKQHYHRSPFVPEKIFVQYEIEDEELLEEWLMKKRDGMVRIAMPEGEREWQLMQMTAKNAELKLGEKLSGEQIRHQIAKEGLRQLKLALSLEHEPKYIEAFDISNLFGDEAVGALVVFKDGLPCKDMYRRFRIKEVKGVDDYAMMREVVGRRIRRLVREGAELPDLIIIDGGRGHLNTARRVLEEEGVSIPIAGLAKREELLYLPDRELPISFPPSSAGLRLLQHIRDEAHRFAITYHRRLRKKGVEESILDQIPGIGKKRKTALLAHFGSVENIAKASLAQLLRVPSMTRKAALSVREFFDKLEG